MLSIVSKDARNMFKFYSKNIHDIAKLKNLKTYKKFDPKLIAAKDITTFALSFDLFTEDESNAFIAWLKRTKKV